MYVGLTQLSGSHTVWLLAIPRISINRHRFHNADDAQLHESLLCKQPTVT